MTVLAAGPYNSGLLGDARGPGKFYNYAPADETIVARAQHFYDVLARTRTDIGAAALQFPLTHPAVARQRQIDDGLFGKLVNAEANISRDRLGKIDLGSWRYQAAGMPGGVMLQIGIHYTDVLEYLMGPVKAVSGQFARLVLPGDNPDVASLVLEHENGALSTLNASYASASEYYLLNIYGKEATAYYDMFEGLRMLKRGEEKPVKVPFANKDTIAEELEEFADAVRGAGAPEIGGEYATTSLAVIRAGIVSAREGRHVEIAEILAKG